MARLIVAVVVVGLAVGAGAFAGTASRGARQAPAEQDSPREIEVRLQWFEFVPDTIEVVEGERIRIRAWSADVTHGFGIPALGVEQLVPYGGKPVMIEFTATEPGTFEFVCTEYCGAGHEDMKGLLVVRPHANGAR